MSYTVVRSEGKVVSIQRDSDGAFIPLDSNNKDYLAFVEWNDAQQDSLDLSDEAHVKKAAKEHEALFYEFAALSSGQMDAVLCVLAARALQKEPELLVNAFSGFSGMSGIGVVGNEPK